MTTPACDTLPMSVANMTFLVNRLGEDCSPLQFLREITQNAIEAVNQLPLHKGEVIWDVAWSHLALDSVYKLCCIDTGAGMTGPEMVKYINELSSSIHQQSATGNFGVGAKIAAAPKNPHGLVYMSWKNGIGHMIHLWFDPEEKVYGLKRWPKNDGEFWTPVSDDLKPPQISENGTTVIFLGASDEHDTMEPPAGTPMKSRWILRYLNTRYFRFPEGVSVRAREGWELPQHDKHNFLRAVEGQGAWLDKHCASKGVVEMACGKAHWWIIKDNVDKDSGHVAPGGHVAALFQNELYEMYTSRAGLTRLQAFGVIFGTDRVVIYIEPKSSSEAQVTANTARTSLLVGGETLDWASYAAHFRENLPQEIVDLQEEIGAKAGENDYKKAIHDRLKQIQDLLRFSRFRPNKEGAAKIEIISSSVTGGEPSVQHVIQRDIKESGKKGGRAGDIYALFAESGPINGDAVNTLSEPQAKWISVSDGTRTSPDLDDRAAKFLIQQNLLLINADFRGFTDMIDRWNLAYKHVSGSQNTVKEVVREWFEQQLIEAVMTAQALKSTGKWSIQELEKLWSEEALTAAILPRWHIDQSIKRSLGHRLGTLKIAA